METVVEIRPKEGLGRLLFGDTMKKALEILGKAEEVEELEDNDCCPTTVWHYWKSGVSVFFDKNNNNVFTCAEVGNADALLWGQPVFKMSEKEIVELFEKHNFRKLEKEVHAWGEKRISFDEALIDFYFENNILTSINYGGYSEEHKIVIFPN